MNKCDFCFFDRALRNARRLNGYPYDVFRGAEEAGSSSQLKNYPRMLVEVDDGGDGVFETTSYATSPGHGLANLQFLIGTLLPAEFGAFYDLYQKALVVTCTYPLYLWPEKRIIDEITERREFLDRPMRTFRFGEHYEGQATQFGLWLEEPGTTHWRVISMDSGTIDEMDDPYVDPDRIIGNSFYEWLKDWIETDGASDPFFEGKFFRIEP